MTNKSTWKKQVCQWIGALILTMGIVGLVLAMLAADQSTAAFAKQVQIKRKACQADGGQYVQFHPLGDYVCVAYPHKPGLK